MIGILVYSICIVRRWRNKWKVRHHSLSMRGIFAYYKNVTFKRDLLSHVYFRPWKICFQLYLQCVISLLVLELICLKIKEQICTIALLRMGQSRGNKIAWLPRQGAIWTGCIFRANFQKVNTGNSFTSYREENSILINGCFFYLVFSQAVFLHTTTVNYL